jgi:hypothetical protein
LFGIWDDLAVKEVCQRNLFVKSSYFDSRVLAQDYWSPTNYNPVKPLATMHVLITFSYILAVAFFSLLLLGCLMLSFPLHTAQK